MQQLSVSATMTGRGERTGNRVTNIATITHPLLSTTHTGRTSSMLPPSTRATHGARRRCPTQVQCVLCQRRGRRRESAQPSGRNVGIKGKERAFWPDHMRYIYHLLSTKELVSFNRWITPEQCPQRLLPSFPSLR